MSTASWPSEATPTTSPRASRRSTAPGWDLPTAVKNAVQVLGAPDSRTIEHDHIEAGVLERSQQRRRKFRRLTDTEVAGFLAG